MCYALFIASYYLPLVLINYFVKKTVLFNSPKNTNTNSCTLLEIFYNFYFLFLFYFYLQNGDEESQKTRPDREKVKLFSNLAGKITKEFVEIFQAPDKEMFLLPSVIDRDR